MDDILKAVAVVVTKGNSVLLVKHGEKAGHISGVYGLPAGRYEENENSKQAAIRELAEETGLHTAEEHLKSYPNNIYTGKFPRKDGSIVTSTMEVFICTGYSEELHATDETEPEWVPIANLESINLLPNVQKAILDAKQYV